MEKVFILKDCWHCSNKFASTNLVSLITRLIEIEWITDDYVIEQIWEYGDTKRDITISEIYGQDWREGLKDMTVEKFNELFYDVYEIDVVTLV